MGLLNSICEKLEVPCSDPVFKRTTNDGTYKYFTLLVLDYAYPVVTEVLVLDLEKKRR